MSIFKRGETWWCDITIHGKRIRESLGTADKAAAQRAHDERRAAAWTEARSTKTHRLNDAAAAWLQAGERSQKDRYRLRAMLETLGDTPLADLNTATIGQALAGQSAGTHNRNRSMLIALLNTARLAGWIDKLPHIPARRVTEPRIRFLTAAEWQRLLAALPAHLKPMARLAISTGLRRKNVTHLEWSQIDMQRRVAWVHPDQAKAGKPIGVPLSDDAMDVLRGQLGKHPRWVFATRKIGEKDGQPVMAPQEQISTGWNAALVRAGIDVFTYMRGDVEIKSSTFRWHDLRHTWASWHVMSGTPLEVLQKLGGWASLAMVMRYAHLAPDHLAGFANNAKPWQNQTQAAA